MKKKVIARVYHNLFSPVAALPAITHVVVPLTLATSEPALLKPGETTVNTVADPKRFLGLTTSLTTDADAYYNQIHAPGTLALWRDRSGFPVRFGDPIPGATLENYATCYYYNLGDLGFARAQTMRVTNGADNQPNIAYAVTNFRTLSDARCQRAPVAHLCMDYSALSDSGTNEFKRYTRFYVYGGDGKLLNCANLDGASDNGTGDKCIPNLCVICHGGTKYRAGGTTNLGSRFLPFDIASYNYHPAFGVQRQELAAMNKAVLKTLPPENVAIANLIEGWYGNPTPLAATLTFNQGYVPGAPITWKATPANEDLYTNVFKHSCRVCHISRDAVNEGRLQFSSYNDLVGQGFGYSSTCTGTLGMPNSQRTWGVFWGSRASNKLGIPNVPNMPTLLRTAASEAGCPVLSEP